MGALALTCVFLALSATTASAGTYTVASCGPDGVSPSWQQKVYPDIIDYLNFLPPFAKIPQLPLTGPDKVYADCVWNHWLEARYGADVIRNTWAKSLSVKPKHDSVASFDASIKEAGGKSFSREFAAFVPVTAECNSSP